jgi:hypothetical protein
MRRWCCRSCPVHDGSFTVPLEDCDNYQSPLKLGHELKYMPMMPPDADLKNHLANRRSLAQARAAYIPPCPSQPSQNNARDSQTVREAVADLRRETPAG